MSCGEVLGIIKHNEGRAFLWDRHWLPPPGDTTVETAWSPHWEQNSVTMVGQVVSHYSPALPAAHRLHIVLFHPMSLVLAPSDSSSEAMGIAPGPLDDYCSQCSSGPSLPPKPACLTGHSSLLLSFLDASATSHISRCLGRGTLQRKLLLLSSVSFPRI